VIGRDQATEPAKDDGIAAHRFLETAREVRRMRLGAAIGSGRPASATAIDIGRWVVLSSNPPILPCRCRPSAKHDPGIAKEMT